MGTAIGAVAYVAVSRPWALSSVLSEVSPMLGTPFFDSMAVSLLATTLFLGEARSALKRETRRAQHEQAAFERFTRRLRRFHTSGSVPTQAPLDADSVAVHRPASTATNNSMAAIRAAYRETVMATPHYQAEFDESLEESVSREFSVDVAMAVTAGVGPPDRLVTELVQQAQGVASLRRAHVTRMDRERAAIDDAEANLSHALETIESIAADALSSRDAGALVAGWNRLELLRADWDALLADRQRALQRNVSDGQATPDMLPSYLYRDLPVTFPILHAGATVAEKIETGKSVLIEAMATLP